MVLKELSNFPLWEGVSGLERTDVSILTVSTSLGGCDGLERTDFSSF